MAAGLRGAAFSFNYGALPVTQHLVHRTAGGPGTDDETKTDHHKPDQDAQNDDG